MINVIKRDGKKVLFDKDKIFVALVKAFHNIKGEVDINLLEKIADNIQNELESESVVTVEQIQDLVEKQLELEKLTELKNEYSSYRKERTRIRETKSNLMETVHKIGIETDRDNANVGGNFSAKLLRIASETNKWHNLTVIPKELAKLHENGDLYYHDLDSYNLTVNCLHIDLKDMLDKGFNTGYGTIRKPKRIEAAAELMCILLQSSQNDMFGGQSIVDFDNGIAEYVKTTRIEISEDHSEYIDSLPNKEAIKFVNGKLEKRVRQAMQGIVYNLNTMHSRAGSQVPFSSLNIGLPESDDAALVCKLFLEEYEKGMGKNEQPIFPNIIFRVKKGVNRNIEDPHYNLFKLACRVAARRMNPTFMNIDADFNLAYYNRGIVPATMGCRTYVCSNVNGKEGPGRRGNNAPTTINLPRIAILSNGDIDKFFNLLDQRLKEATDSLLHRYDTVKKLKVKDLPFVAGQRLMQGSEGLGPNDSIEPIVKQGSWGIGFIGLAETLISLTGKHHGESEKSRELGLMIIKYMRDYTDKLTKETHLNWSTYATPAEGVSGKLLLSDRNKFGIIPGITDKDYYTNSYHVPVGYKIPIKEKIQIEAPYHKLCNAGHISYIELDGYPDGETIESIIKYAYENTNISYIGINFHMKFCKECGQLIEDKIDNCPKCGSDNIQGVSRVTGYLSLDERFGPSKEAERRDRIAHTTFEHNYTMNK